MAKLVGLKLILVMLVSNKEPEANHFVMLSANHSQLGNSC